MHSPWAGGVILVAFAVLALILANIPQTAGVYHHLLESHLTVGFDHFRLSKPLEAWINDGLMVIFFFYVGLEIKREIIAGQLSGVRRAALPVAAAIGGMAVPALIYVLINRSGDFLSGWGIPMATDIAFAIGILSLLGNRVPVSLKVFLMALAVVDDLGGILVIAVFYSTDIQVGMLVAAAVVFVFMILLKRLNVYKMRYYLILSIVMWILFLYSGIHATIAGVLIALTIPSTPRFTKRYFSYKTRYYLRSFRRHDREGVQVLSNRKQLEDIEMVRLVATMRSARRNGWNMRCTTSSPFLLCPFLRWPTPGSRSADSATCACCWSRWGWESFSDWWSASRWAYFCSAGWSYG